MKNYKKIVPILLVIVFAASVYVLFSERIKSNAQYNDYVAQGDKYAEDGILAKAADAYANAIQMKSSPDLYLKIGNMYVENEEYGNAIAYGETIISQYPKKNVGYEFLLDVYCREKMYTDAFELYETFVGRKLSSEKVDELYKTFQYTYEEGYSSYDDIGCFCGGYWTVNKKGLWGYAYPRGGTAISCMYKAVMPFVSGQAAVTTESGDIYFIDEEGIKTEVFPESITVSAPSLYVEPLAIKSGDKYNFYDKSYNLLFGDYDEIAAFNGSVTAVKSGTSWFLVNSLGEKVTEAVFNDVKIDNRGLATTNGLFFVDNGSGYIMINESGERVGELVFEDAKPFSGNNPAAVKMGGKWGFVNVDGTMFIDCQYDDANSFTTDLAAVCKNEKWGYISKDNELAIPYNYILAKNFNDVGVTFVFNGEDWVPLKLLKYNY